MKEQNNETKAKNQTIIIVIISILFIGFLVISLVPFSYQTIQKVVENITTSSTKTTIKTVFTPIIEGNYLWEFDFKTDSGVCNKKIDFELKEKSKILIDLSSNIGWDINDQLSAHSNDIRFGGNPYYSGLSFTEPIVVELEPKFYTLSLTAWDNCKGDTISVKIGTLEEKPFTENVNTTEEQIVNKPKITKATLLNQWTGNVE